MLKQAHLQISSQRGVATLAIGIILLILITLVSLYGMRVTVLEQRVSANDYRSKEAYGAAQAGLNYGIEFAKSYEGLLRSTVALGWLDGTRDLATTPATPNLEWSAPVDCNNPADQREQRVCDAVENSGLGGSVRLFDSGFDVADESTFGVPIWPDSGSGAFADCPGGSCRAHVELVLCEFDRVGNPPSVPPPPVPCASPGSTSATRPEDFAVLVLARGESADGTAEASVRQLLTPFDLFQGNTLPPLMAASNVNISGTMDVVVNPDGVAGGIDDGTGRGKGEPLSGWSGNDLVLSGNASFCYPDEYYQSSGADLTALPVCADDLSNQPCVANVNTSHGSCPLPVCSDCDCPTSGDEALTKPMGSIYDEGIDVLDRDGNAGKTYDDTSFPSDVFKYIFGVPSADYQVIKDQAQVVTDCSTINASTGGFYWVTGNCQINGDAGSPAHPLIIVTEGNLRMEAGGQFFGLAFAFSNSASGISGGDTVSLQGGPEIFGIIVSDHQVDFGGGNYDLIYSKCLFDLLSSDDSLKRLEPVPGSWADHL